MHPSSPHFLLLAFDPASPLRSPALTQQLGLPTPHMLSSSEEAERWLNGAVAQPAFVLVDLGNRGQEMFPLLQRLSRFTQGRSRIVAAGTTNDLAFYRALRGTGVHEYFTHPVRVDELREALMQPVQLPNAAPRVEYPTQPKREGRVVAFIGAASGDGSSTLALNTAYALAAESRKPTVVVDLDYQFGMLARQLDLQAPFGLRELFESPERGVDATLVSKTIMQYSGNLHVIAAPEPLRGLPAIPAQTMHEFISVLKSQFDTVVLDVPHVWLPFTATALASADRVVVTAQLWLRSLTHLTRLMAAWQEEGVSNDRVLLAMNRTGARFREAITTQDFERISLKPVSFTIANDTKAVTQAEHQGKTVAEVSGSTLERQFRDAARLIQSSLSGHAVQPLVAKPLAPKLNFKTRLGKKS